MIRIAFAAAHQLSLSLSLLLVVYAFIVLASVWSSARMFGALLTVVTG